MIEKNAIQDGGWVGVEEGRALAGHARLSPHPAWGLDKTQILEGSSTELLRLRSPVPGFPYINNLGSLRKAKHASHRAPGGTVRIIMVESRPKWN